MEVLAMFMHHTGSCRWFWHGCQVNILYSTKLP